MKKAVILVISLVFALVIACSTDSTITGPHNSKTPHGDTSLRSSSS